MRQACRVIACVGSSLAAWIVAGAAPASPPSGIDYPTFARLIRERGVASVDEALALLPAEMRINYTMMHHSRSIQQGSLEAPRVLLFGSDARLIVTFNGSPDETGYDKLEILHFDEATETFELRSIEFGKEVRFSDANPEICLACHKRSPQPIWKDYGSPNAPEEHGVWTGSYGPSHDFVPEELRPALRRFWAAAPGHPRYRHLLRDPESDLFPYQPTDGRLQWQHRFRPNARLSRLVARLNARRIARALQQNELFRDRKHLVLSWLLECDEWQTDLRLGAEIRRLFGSRFPETDHRDLYADLRSVQQDDRSAIPFMLEKIFTGLDVYQWNMSVVTPTANRYHEGIETIDQLVAGRLLERVASQDAALAPYYRPVSFAEAYGSPLYHRIDAGGAVWRGEIGDLYDRVGLYHDRPLAKRACGIVVPRARAEIATPTTSPVAPIAPAARDAAPTGTY